MKFNILDYSQRIAISMGLDLKDLHILGWIQDFYPKMKKIIVDNEEYSWVNYQTLIEDMPILEINAKDALYRRLKNLVKIGLLKHHGVKNSSGSYSFYKITPKIIELLEDRPSKGGADEKSDGSDTKPKGADEKSDRVRMKSRTKDSSTNNSPTKPLSLKSRDEIEEIIKREKFNLNIEKFYSWYEREMKSGGLRNGILNVMQSMSEKPQNQIKNQEDNYKELCSKIYKALLPHGSGIAQRLSASPLDSTTRTLYVMDKHDLKYAKELEKINIKIKLKS